MTVRFGAGAYFGLGLVTPYGTTGKSADIDFLLRAQDGTDALEYKRNRLDPKDLSSYDEQFDQVQPGEETVEGSASDKCTFNAMQDLFRMMNGANPTVSGSNPYTYAFTGANRPSKFSDPNHYQAGTTTRNFVVEMYKGSILRSTVESAGAYTGLTFVVGPPSTISRAAGTFDTTVYKRGAVVTLSGGTGACAAFNGVYVLESATTTLLTLRTTGAGWFASDALTAGDTSSGTPPSISAVYQESLYYQGMAIKGLKLDFQRNDYVQRSIDWLGTTFTTGASSHSYRTAKHVSNAQAGTSVVITTTTITRTGSWITDGYVIGGTVTLIDPEDAANAKDFVISALTATVLTTTGLTANGDDDTVHFTGNGITNIARIPGGTPASQPTLWVTDYATTNPGMGSTKFLTLGGTTFICRSASVMLEEPLEDRYDIGQSSSELRLPEKKRSVKIEVEIETSDEKFLEILKRPDTKSFGASGGDYTGINQLKIEGAGSTAGRSITFLFPYLTIEGAAETRVEGIGPTTAKFTLMAMSDDVNNPAYTVTVVNADAAYRT